MLHSSYVRLAKEETWNILTWLDMLSQQFEMVAVLKYKQKFVPWHYLESQDAVRTVSSNPHNCSD